MLVDRFLGERDMGVLRNKVLAGCQKRLRALNMTQEDWEFNMKLIAAQMNLVDEAISENRRLRAHRLMVELYDAVDKLCGDA
jgi:hypothetical protein